MYTAWYRNSIGGEGIKEFFFSRGTLAQLKAHLEASGKVDVLVWEGNWFGLAPDNLPGPDYTYGIAKEDDAEQK